MEHEGKDMNDLKVFLYLLMRDQLPTGKVESIMMEIRGMRAAKNKPVYSALHLANYAEELAEELLSVFE
jgi:hypothetical protein